MNSTNANNSTCEENQNTEIDYNEELDNNPHKYVVVAWTIILMLVSNVMSCSIIYYEKFGSDKKRTIINQLVSMMCWNFIVWNMSIQVAGLARIFIGPFNTTLCFWIYVLRYIFIFIYFVSPPWWSSSGLR